ncbi:MAG: hypothetical protein QXY45_00815 [Candidatus Aenigmatarchaeota archaeon]
MPEDYRGYLRKAGLPRDPNQLTTEQYLGLNALQRYAAMRGIGVGDAHSFKEAHDDFYGAYRRALNFLRKLGYSSERAKNILNNITWDDVVD